jgi:anti-anti-sigma regulatory factor
MSLADTAGLLVEEGAERRPPLAAAERSRTIRVRALRSPAEPNTLVLVIRGPIGRADVEELCDRIRDLLEANDADRIVFDLGALPESDAVTVDMLARVQLTARRIGRRVLLRNACEELKDLLALMGLREVLPPCVELPLESRDHAEQGENRSVSRKKLIPEIRSPEISSTWSDQGSRLPDPFPGLY